MGFLSGLKAQKALSLHGKGQIEEAKKLYQEVIAEGVNQPRVLLAYSTLLLREGEYQTAREMLVKLQKAPGLSEDQRIQMFINYAACMCRLGHLDKGIDLLERQHRKQPSGLVYQTLGYLYVEKYVPDNRPVADPPTVGEDGEEIPPSPTQEELDAQWEEGVQTALDFEKESIDYDDEDAICLDNMAQFVYRVQGDKAAAKEWFEKALEQKPGQIDTLGFLSLYDEEEGNKEAAMEKLEKALSGRFSPLNHFSKEALQQRLDHLKK